MLTQADIDEIVEVCDPDEIWDCDVQLIRDLLVEARAKSGTVATVKWRAASDGRRLPAQGDGREIHGARM
ncbi:MAG TPA: hypothetical protein VEH77_15560 [Roseiarcus sp.]|nr:hypothetical protein [Roseiarcus sp.]